MRCFGNPLRKRFQPRGRGANLSQRGEGSCLQLGCSEITIITMKTATFHEDVLYRGRGQRPNKRWQGGGACPVRTAHGSGRDRSFQRAPRAKSFGSALILVLSEVMRAPLRRNAFFSKDSEKSAAGEFAILEGRRARNIVSPTLVGIPNFYNELDNFFTGRSSVLARPGLECSGIPNFYNEKCVRPFRPKSVINVTRLHVTCLPSCGLHPKAATRS